MVEANVSLLAVAFDGNPSWAIRVRIGHLAKFAARKRVSRSRLILKNKLNTSRPATRINNFLSGSVTRATPQRL